MPARLTVWALTGWAFSPAASDRVRWVPEPNSSRSEAGDVVREAPFGVAAAISNAMVRLYKNQFGRGPTSARTLFAGPDTVVVVLEDTLTPAERNLVRMGEHQRLRDTRLFFQYASVGEFCEPIERLTGRKVRSFLSSTDTVVDGLSVETFLLHPEGYDGPSRIELDERTSPGKQATPDA
jgi:uncharacterized protein YbcI